MLRICWILRAHCVNQIKEQAVMRTYDQTLKLRILTKFDPPLAPPTINHPLSMSLLIKFLLLLPMPPLTPSPFSTTLIATIIGYFNCTQNYSKHILFFYFLDYKGKQKFFSIIIFHWKYFPPDNIFHGKKKGCGRRGGEECAKNAVNDTKLDMVGGLLALVGPIIIEL